MDADQALAIVYDELAKFGYPPGVPLSYEQKQRWFATLRSYAAASGRPLAVAARESARTSIYDHELRSQQ